MSPRPPPHLIKAPNHFTTPCASWATSTSAASVFAAELTAAYPGARAVLVQRDFESWLASVDTVFISSVLDPRRKLLYDLVVRPVRKLHFYVYR
ncbi:hypothetical protein INS49_004937 [Diaporthe citri]|uniref:uncharacterized protein n=1 Tax=Diaporthe citri TaxID=83186 RepID=UPI001C805A26|nr:uncharacterized protein INS49_004937 [Diaporthe citri]KAG6354332.1 hypothetical protein INS49_004937 [Diaporthe citri]